MRRSGWKDRVQDTGAPGWIFFARPGVRIPPAKNDGDFGIVVGMSWAGCWLLLGIVAWILYGTDVLSGTAAMWLGWLGPLIVALLINLGLGALRYWLDGPTRLLRMVGDGTVTPIRRTGLSKAVARAAAADRPGYVDQVKILQRIDRLRALAAGLPELTGWLPVTDAPGTAGSTGGSAAGSAAGSIGRFGEQLRRAADDEAQLIAAYSRDVLGTSLPPAAFRDPENPADASNDSAARRKQGRKRKQGRGFNPRVARQSYDGPGTSVEPTWLVAAPDEVLAEPQIRLAHPGRGLAIAVLLLLILATLGQLRSAWLIILILVGGFAGGWLWRKWLTPLTSRTGRAWRSGRVVRLADTPLNRTIVGLATSGSLLYWELARQAAELDELNERVTAGPPATGTAADRVAVADRDHAEQRIRLAMSDAALREALELLRPTDAAIAVAGTVTAESYQQLERIRVAILEANS